MLTNKNKYDSSASPSALVHHHALRYVLRVLSSTIFGSEDNKKIHRREGTTLWCLGNDDDEELPPPEMMTLHVLNNWSFHGNRPHVQTPLLPKPPASSTPLEGARVSPMLIEQALTKLQKCVDEIKVEQKEIKDPSASISKTFTNFGVWLQSQGFPHPPPFPPSMRVCEYLISLR
uniref:Uncharacterized protein n=1 Tax=Chenopodium quinoa TaxID=63459 RepID=A0A803LG99_CHEQI